MRDLKKFFLMFIFCLIPLTAQGASHTSRIHVYAWLDNDQVIVECNYGNSQPAFNTQVTILDADTRQRLLSGVTNNSGHFAFKVPSVIRDGHGLLIVVDAGKGQQAEWLMPASELYAAASLTAGFDQAAIAEQKLEGATPNNTPPQAARRQPRQAPRPEDNLPLPQSTITLTPEQLQNLIHQAVETQVAPLRRDLATQSVSEPSIMEIIGGIGWIVGIIGIILYFRSRRPENKN